MFKVQCLVLTLCLASTAFAGAAFSIGEPAFEPAMAQFVVGSSDGFFTADSPHLTRVADDGSLPEPGGKFALKAAWPGAISAVAGANLVVLSCANKECDRTVAVTTDGQPAWVVEGVGGIVVFDGTNFVVLDRRTDNLRVTFVDRAGVVLRTTYVPLPGSSDFSAARVGDALIVAFDWNGHGPSIVRIDDSGHADPPKVVDSWGWKLKIASSGDEALLVWSWSPGSQTCPCWNWIFGARVDSNAQVGERFELTRTKWTRELGVAWDGSRYRVVGSDEGESLVYGDERVFALDVPLPKFQGTQLTPGPVVDYAPPGARHPTIAVSGDRVLFGYDKTLFGPTEARFLSRSQLAKSLKDSEPRSIFKRSRSEYNGAIAWNGDHYTAVWGRPGEQHTIVGREFSADGTPLGPVVTLAVASPLFELRIATVGDVSLVLWSEAGTVRAIRVEHGLTVLGEVMTLGSGYALDLATSGDDFGVAWLSQDFPSKDKNTIHGRVIGGDGTITPSAPFVLAQGYYYSGVAVEWRGRNYVAAFANSYSVPCGDIAITCGNADTYFVDFPVGAALQPVPRRIALETQHFNGAFVRGNRGIVFMRCLGEYGCFGSLIRDGEATVAHPVRISSWKDGISNIVWTGDSYLALGMANGTYFRFDTRGVVLERGVGAHGGAAASSGDGRAMVIFPYDGGSMHAAIVGGPGRRRAATH